jgi:hypothetical protein
MASFLTPGLAAANSTVRVRRSAWAMFVSPPLLFCFQESTMLSISIELLNWLKSNDSHASVLNDTIPNRVNVGPIGKALMTALTNPSTETSQLSWLPGGATILVDWSRMMPTSACLAQIFARTAHSSKTASLTCELSSVYQL